MNSVPASNPAGEKVAEAVLAAALALPLAFAVAGLKHSRLIQDLDSLPKINWSSSPSLIRERQEAMASPMPANGLGRIPKSKPVSQLRKTLRETQTNRKPEAASGANSPGESLTTAAASTRQGPQQLQNHAPTEPSPQ